MNQYMPRRIKGKIIGKREGAKKPTHSKFWALSFYSHLALLYLQLTHACIRPHELLNGSLHGGRLSECFLVREWVLAMVGFMLCAFSTLIHRGHQQLGNGAYTSFRSSCTLLKPRGFHLSRVYTEYSRGEDTEFGIWIIFTSVAWKYDSSTKWILFVWIVKKQLNDLKWHLVTLPWL